MKLGLPVQWKIAGVLLIVGGALSAIGAAVFNFGPQETGTLTTTGGVFFEGAGLVTASFAYGAEDVAVWARRMLLVSGIIVLVEFLATVVSFLGADVSSLISVLLYIALAAVLLICVIAIFRSVPAGRTVRWALLPVGAFQAADFALLISGYGGEWWTLGVLGILYVLAGIIFVGYRLRKAAR